MDTILAFALLCLGSAIQVEKLRYEGNERPKLLLVSFDGFRHDYIEMYNAENFKHLHSMGIRTRWIVNQFVTKTFPNHWSIATGLYEESHGIVSNHFFASDLDKEFNAFGRPAFKWAWDPKFWGGEPIWKTNEKQGKTSGSLFWVGSEVPVMRPTHWLRYNQDMDWHERVDTVVEWLTNTNTSFSTLYFHEPDHTGHEYGPVSPELGEIMKKVDGILGYLISKLPHDINLIVTSDHGMVGLEQSKAIQIEEALPRDMYKKWFGELTHAGIWPHKDEDLPMLKARVQNLHPKLTAWFRHEIPERFHLKHFKGASRVPPLILVAEEPWQVCRTMREAKLKGEHGYDNMNMNMHPIFFAKGPDFVTEPEVLEEPFSNVDIYPLMCHLLGINPAPNNGTLCDTSHLLKNPPNVCGLNDRL